MKRLIVFALLMFGGVVTTIAQVTVKAQVLDIKTEKPVPFALVKNKIKNTGGFTSEDGFLLVEAQVGDTLEIHSLGYHTKLFVVLEKNDLVKIHLEPNDVILDEVTIVASRKKIKGQKEEYGYHNDNKDLYSSLNVPIGFQVAVYISNENNIQGYINKAYFRLKKVGFQETLFRVRVYKFDPLTNLPGEEITRQQITETVTFVKGNLSVDLTPYNIEFPKEGVVLALEFLGEKDKLGKFVKKYEFFKLQIARSKNSEQNLTFFKNLANGWSLYSLKATNGSSTNAMFGIQASIPQ